MGYVILLNRFWFILISVAFLDFEFLDFLDLILCVVGLHLAQVEFPLALRS